MQILRFQKTIKLELPDHLRQALDRILEHRPEIQSDNELLIQVLDEAMNTGSTAPNDQPATVQTVAERMAQRLKQMAKDAMDLPAMATIASRRPFPKITRRYKDPRKEHVESYVATVIPKDVRHRLQALLDSQSDLDLEQTLPS
jgi:hypothetical protein